MRLPVDDHQHFVWRVVRNGSLDANEVVTALYEAMLQRSPDPEGLRLYVSELQAGRSLSNVIEMFLSSDEFRGRFTPASENSFPLDNAPPMSIQTDLKSDEHRALWKHISSVWSRYGETDPFWSVLTDERWRSINITDKQIISSFYQTGESEVQRLDSWLRRSGLALKQDAVCAEYGCGVGRVTHVLARRFHRVLAFDISQPHLDAAQQRLLGEGVDNVDYVLVHDEGSLSRLNDIDLFYSVIVLQHNPPPIMADILNRAFSGLKPGGLAFFQIPTYSLNYSFSVVEYWNAVAREKTMEMHFLSQKIILDIGRKYGIHPVEIQPDWCVGHPERWISTTFLMHKQS